MYDLEGKILKEIIKQREGNTDVIVSRAGNYKICWRSMDNKPKVLSFDVSIGEKTEKAAASNGTYCKSINILIFFAQIILNQ